MGREAKPSAARAGMFFSGCRHGKTKERVRGARRERFADSRVTE